MTKKAPRLPLPTVRVAQIDFPGPKGARWWALAQMAGEKPEVQDKLRSLEQAWDKGISITDHSMREVLAKKDDSLRQDELKSLILSIQETLITLQRYVFHHRTIYKKEQDK